MRFVSNKEIAKAFDYFHKKLVNEICNHAGLSDRDAVVLGDAILNAAKQTKEQYEFLSENE